MKILITKTVNEYVEIENSNDLKQFFEDNGNVKEEIKKVEIVGGNDLFKEKMSKNLKYEKKEGYIIFFVALFFIYLFLFLGTMYFLKTGTYYLFFIPPILPMAIIMLFVGFNIIKKNSKKEIKDEIEKYNNPGYLYGSNLFEIKKFIENGNKQ